MHCGLHGIVSHLLTKSTSQQGLLKLESDQKSKLIETDKVSYNREQTQARGHYGA
jgi:hypothetical protein